MRDAHDCPGGCGAQVPRRQLACKPCWFRLPVKLRDEVYVAYQGRLNEPRRHRIALMRASLWYRNNPRSPR